MSAKEQSINNSIGDEYAKQPTEMNKKARRDRIDA